MRPIWKGQISFGLINIPIELFTAEKRKDLQFKLLDKRNKAKIRYERVNEKTGKEVPWDEVVKAYEIKKKGYIVVSEEELKRAAVENTQTFEIEDFVDRSEIESAYYEKPYFLVPTKQGKKGYVLLREVLEKTQKAAIGKVVIRTKQYLAAVLTSGDVLMLNLMRFGDELKSASDFDIPKGSVKEYKITYKEIEMGEQLVASMSVKWNPKKYTDTYHDTLMKYIEKKAKLGKIPLPPKHEEEKAKGGEVIDFMELLKKSLTKKEPKKTTSSRKRKTTKTKAKKA
jgi:DNA end-binding protein Ku